MDDPGIGISADKGSLIEKTCHENEMNINRDECLFVDDSAGNMVSAVGKCDLLWIESKSGMDGSDFNYLETRSRWTTFLLKEKPHDGDIHDA